MNDLLTLVLSVAVGFALGIVFYGGLWWTVNSGIASKEPALWFFGSMILRTSVVVTGFYFVSHGRWDRAVLCLVGFVISRIIVTCLTRSQRCADISGTPNEVSHAP